MWDSITAISAAVGVVVAATLSVWAVHTARRTIIRSELEYRAQRADMVIEKAASITSLACEYKASLQVFWKEPFEEVRDRWVDSVLAEKDSDGLVAARFSWLMEQRGAGELKAHELDYTLRGAAAVFRALVDAAGVDHVDSSPVFALLDVLRGSLRVQYLSLIRENAWNLDPGSCDYPSRLLSAMASEIVCFMEHDDDALRQQIVDWFRARLESERDKSVSAAQTAVDFHESFVEQRWLPECRRLLKSAHQSALSTP